MKLNPPLVNYNKYLISIGIRNLANLRSFFNCDIVYQNVNPISVKKITRETLEIWKYLLACISWPYSIPSSNISQVSNPINYMGGSSRSWAGRNVFTRTWSEMNRRYREDHDLFGFSANSLNTVFNTLNENDLWNYKYQMIMT